MECLSPIRITTLAKYISPCFSDSFVQFVRCGRCASCQETLSREWYFRAFHEYKDTVNKNGYMLMDCLTYSPKFVPRVDRFFRASRDGSDYIRLPRKLNFMCFDYKDLRYFFVRLRTYLKKRGFDIEQSLRYFAACEYGTDSDCTHRPHIHILFYCTCPGLDNLTLSRAISFCWKYGRTDGLPYKSARYVNDYTISKGLLSSQRACKYVSKYVMKSSVFQKIIDKRISAIMHWIYDNRFTFFSVSSEKWDRDGLLHTEIKKNVDWSGYMSFCTSEGGKKIYRDLRRQLDQFHRQSLGFGASALGEFDIDEIMRSNIVSIPDSSKIVFRLGLPMYYKRKLFYQQTVIDGVKYWIPNDLGKTYLEKRKLDTLKRLRETFSLAKLNYHFDIDSVGLSDYVVNKRGRIKGVFDGDSTVVDRVNSPLCYYNYNTTSDRKRFHFKFMSRTYLGNSKRYNDDVPIDLMPIDNFIAENVYFDDEKEKILSKLDDLRFDENNSIQLVFDNRQRLNQVYKQLELY